MLQNNTQKAEGTASDNVLWILMFHPLQSFETSIVTRCVFEISVGCCEFAKHKSSNHVFFNTNIDIDIKADRLHETRMII